MKTKQLQKKETMRVKKITADFYKFKNKLAKLGYLVLVPNEETFMSVEILNIYTDSKRIFSTPRKAYEYLTKYS